MKLKTIQQNGKLNDVHQVGEIGPGGAYHEYDITSIEEPKESSIPSDPILLSTIVFQKGPRKEPDSIHGVLDVDLLEIVRDRLQHFQAGPYACPENEVALIHIETALRMFNKRVEDRIKRNVLGKNQK